MTKSKWARIAADLLAKRDALAAEFEELTRTWVQSDGPATVARGDSAKGVTPPTAGELVRLAMLSTRIHRAGKRVRRLTADMQRHAAREP